MMKRIYIITVDNDVILVTGSKENVIDSFNSYINNNGDRFDMCRANTCAKIYDDIYNLSYDFTDIDNVQRTIRVHTKDLIDLD